MGPGRFSWVVLAFVSMVGVAEAQPSAADRARAAEAYDRGAAAFRARDYGASARAFETANRILPSWPAVVQAIRAHGHARDVQRAGTLALQLEDEAGLPARAMQTVRQAIAAARGRYVRVEVACSASCTLRVGGEEESLLRFFVEPGRELEIVASFPGGTRTERVVGPAGSVRSIAFEAPAGAEPVVEPSEPIDEVALDDGENPYRISRLRFLSRPRATFFVTLASTSVIGGVTVWSAVDARASRLHLADVRASGTSEAIAIAEAEHARDVRRTHGFLGFSALVLVVNGLVAGFTDWTPNGDEEGTDATIEASPQGASVVVTHRF